MNLKLDEYVEMKFFKFLNLRQNIFAVLKM